MAKGITIGEVENVLDGQNITGTEKIPVSSGQTEPQVVTINELKGYLTKDLMNKVKSIVPTKVSDLENDSGFTSNKGTVTYTEDT